MQKNHMSAHKINIIYKAGMKMNTKRLNKSKNNKRKISFWIHSIYCFTYILFDPDHRCPNKT